MTKKKNLSRPFSTGGGGAYFEAHMQALFVALMLTSGNAPCLPCWPIAVIKLQGKIDGYDTDDLIVFVENADNKDRRRLLGQVKHSIAITYNTWLQKAREILHSLDSPLSVKNGIWKVVNRVEFWNLLS